MKKTTFTESQMEDLLLLEQRNQEYAAKLARLRLAIIEGDAAVARRGYEEIKDDRLIEWLGKLGSTARNARRG